jgi:hypothetical protein
MSVLEVLLKILEPIKDGATHTAGPLMSSAVELNFVYFPVVLPSKGSSRTKFCTEGTKERLGRYTWALGRNILGLYI